MMAKVPIGVKFNTKKPENRDIYIIKMENKVYKIVINWSLYAIYVFSGKDTVLYTLTGVYKGKLIEIKNRLDKFIPISPEELGLFFNG